MKGAASLNHLFLVLARVKSTNKREFFSLQILGSMTVERLGKLTALSDRKGVLIPVGFT